MMSEQTGVRVSLLLPVALAVAVCGGLSCDKGLQPVGLKDYVVYMADAKNVGLFYGYHLISGQVDSLVIPIRPDRMTASADGTRLYLALADSSLVVEVANPDRITRLPYAAPGGIAVSPDNRLVAVQGEDLYILRTSDYSVVYSDTDCVNSGRFSPDSRQFYAAARTGTYVYIADVTGDYSVIREAVTGGRVVHVAPSRDDSLLFLYVSYSRCTHAFIVFDVCTDSITFRHIFEPGYGELEVTATGGQVFYTYPDATITYCFGAESSFSVFDLRTTSLTDVALPTQPGGSADQGMLRITGIEITPDSRFLAGIDPDRGILAIVEIRSLRTVRYHSFGPSTHLFGLTCQKGH